MGKKADIVNLKPTIPLSADKGLTDPRILFAFIPADEI